ncbi:transcriptional regulator MraZ [Parapedobacter pyrenivorans]|uniref:Transcriptional regulator MraZ n=2 Tax=Parapedobacter pyrenivorans TaxID=1305674 RepID=A0A917M870_9SPHI|nr:transcriptional regulator MraZ [Parapedobacter pyrenivorans]
MWKTFLWGKVGESGVNSYFYIRFIAESVYMGHLIGEFDCKLDTKGRMVWPAALKRQMPDVERSGLIVNRGFEKHLVIYPRNEWDRITRKLAKLNTYKARNRKFIRDFTRGATELALDSAGRVLLPKSLLEYGRIETEIVLSCQFNKIEVWSKEAYNELWEDDEDDDFAALAEEVMGDDGLADEDDE